MHGLKKSTNKRWIIVGVIAIVVIALLLWKMSQGGINAGKAFEYSNTETINQLVPSTTVVGKEYEFRSGKAQCNYDGTYRIEAGSIAIVSCTPTEFVAKCAEGKMITFGGWCQGEMRRLDADGSVASSSWSQLPTFEKTPL